MRISTEQLPQQLKRNLASLYTVFGDEALLAIEAADRIRSSAREKGHTEREVFTTDQHFDWSQLRASGLSQSLFATQRIIELRIPSGKPGVEGGQALQSFCGQLPADTIVLIQLPELDWRAQKGAWFGALDAAGVMVEARKVVRGELPAWLGDRLKAQEQQADDETLAFIADKVEGNLLAAFQETQKLALLFPPGKLSFGQVKEAVLDVARFDVSDLGEVVISGNVQHLARVLDGLQGEGVAPPLILWTMTEEMRAAGRLLSLLNMGRPMQQAMREARIWGQGRQTVLQRHVKRHSTARVEAALRHAARIDRMIKGLVKGDVWDELLQLGMRFAAPRRMDAPNTR
jgi:DNA polymerase-3 subunit delta